MSAQTSTSTTGRHAAVPAAHSAPDVDEAAVVEVTLRVPEQPTSHAAPVAAPASGEDRILPVPILPVPILPVPASQSAAEAAAASAATTTGGWSAWQSLSRAAPAVAVAARTATGAHVLNTQVVDAVQPRLSTLQIGSSGRRVLAWQQALNGWRTAHGRSALAADATFGPLTRTATVDFQQASGLAPDGVVGPATSAALSSGPAASTATAPTPPSAPAVAPPRSGSAGAAVAAASKKYLGVPYRYGGTSPSGFDCAGFTQYVFGQLGVALPRTSQAQASAGSGVASSNARAGDLVVFWSGSTAHHVGIYLGAGMMIAAPKTGDHVKIQSVYSSQVTYRRVI